VLKGLELGNARIMQAGLDAGLMQSCFRSLSSLLIRWQDSHQMAGAISRVVEEGNGPARSCVQLPVVLSNVPLAALILPLKFSQLGPAQRSVNLIQSIVKTMGKHVV